MIHSPIAKSAINLELSKPIIKGVLDIFKQISSTIKSPYMYYYYFEGDKKPIANSFEEKSLAQLICLYSNLGIDNSYILLILLGIVHNEYYHFFTMSQFFEDPIFLIDWMEKFIKTDKKVLMVDSPLSPSNIIRNGKIISGECVEILHSRDYK